MRRFDMLGMAAGLAAALCVLLGGCGAVQVRYPDGTTQYKSRAEFAAYTEAVFRYHNRVVNDLIVAMALFDDDEAEVDAALLRAEEAMSASCSPLNASISATMEGGELGFFEALQLPAVVPACEVASRRVESLLREAR